MLRKSPLLRALVVMTLCGTAPLSALGAVAVASPVDASSQHRVGQVGPSVDSVFGDFVGAAAGADGLSSASAQAATSYRYYDPRDPAVEKRVNRLSARCPKYLLATNEHWRSTKKGLGTLTLHRVRNFGEYQRWTVKAKKPICGTAAWTYDGKVFFPKISNSITVTDPMAFKEHAVQSFNVRFAN